MKVAYIRVSTIEQNLDRQTRIDVEKTYSDKVSGSISFNERPQAKKLIKDIELGLVTEVQVSSIDRLGRNLTDIKNTIDLFTQNKVCLVSDKEGIRTLDANGKENTTAKLVVGILASISEFELNRIKERQLEGIARAKEKGSFTGRKPGTLEDKEVFLNKAKNQRIVKYLKQGESIRRTALLSQASVGTVQKVKKIINL